MKQHILRPLGAAVAASGLLAAALVGSSAAQADSTAATDVLSTPADAQAIMDFWAPEKLKIAEAHGFETQTVAKHVSTGGPAADGKPGIIPAIGDEKKTVAKSKNINLPKTIGRAFFTFGGNAYSCTASSIQSAYRNLVVTAGHCVYDLVGTHKVADNWIFIPGYYQGKRPWGTYIGKQAFTHYDLDVYEDVDRDYAFVTVYNGIVPGSAPRKWVDVGPLGARVGGQGLAYNQKPGKPVFVFGYPAAAHPDGNYVFSGETVKWCYGKTIYPVVEPKAKVEEHVGLKCSMTGGSSGAPWLLGYKSVRRLGYVNGVTSLGGDTDGNKRSDLVTSPYFDGETYGVYKAAYPLWSGSLVRVDGSLGLTNPTPSPSPTSTSAPA